MRETLQAKAEQVKACGTFEESVPVLWKLYSTIDRELELKKAVMKESLRFTRNRKMIEYCSLKYTKNGCNLNFCNYPETNIGDMLSPVIVDWMLKRKHVGGICNGKHLYAVGSILGLGYADAVIWGSGILSENDYINLSYGNKLNRKLDVRAVRGPWTRKLLIKMGKSKRKLKPN